MTIPSSTPTPPADTRQQAAALCGMRIPTEHPHISQSCGLPSGHWQHSATIHTGTAALASSSPALPEPPAPTPRPNDISRWVLAQNTVLAAPATSYREDPWVHDGYNDMSPAEARLLASTLLAAADVAEEQQP